jgi:hypothetical protein
MERRKAVYTLRQREAVKYLLNYVEWLSEKLEFSKADTKPLGQAVKMLPAVREKIIKNDFESLTNLFKGIDGKIVEYFEREKWQPPWKKPPPDTPPESLPD